MRHRWTPGTRLSIELAFGRWLAWLRENRPSAFAGRVAGRMEAEVLRDYAMALRRDLAAASVVTALIQVRLVFRVISFGWDEPWMERLIRHVRRQSRDSREKPARLVRSTDLLLLGRELMAAARLRAPAPMQLDRARVFRDGLAIALLALRPLRLANFLGLRLGSGVLRRRETTWLIVSEKETKNRIPLQLPLPRALAEDFSFYLKRVRPVLLAQACRSGGRGSTEALWLSGRGRPWSRNGFYNMVCGRTALRFGKRVNPHLFRDCLATSVTVERPDLGWTVPFVLGHSSETSSEKAYIHVSEAAALKLFSRHLTELRTSLRAKSVYYDGSGRP